MRKPFAILAVFSIFTMVAIAPVRSVNASYTQHQLASLVSVAHADGPVVAASPAPSQSAIGNIGDFLSGLAGSLPTTGIAITLGLFLIDLIRRKWPTKDPSSLIRDFRKLLGGLDALLQKFDAFLDGLLGQNLS